MQYGKDELKRSKEMEGQLKQGTGSDEGKGRRGRGGGSGGSGAAEVCVGMNPNGGVAERERKDIRKEERFVGKCLGNPFSLLSS